MRCPRLMEALVVVALITIIPANAAYVYWNNYSAGGLWQDGSNWSSKPSLPGSNDNAYIGISGSNVIDHSSGNHTVKSFRCDELFKLSGGVFSVTEASQALYDFYLTGGVLAGTGLFTIAGESQWTAGGIANTGGLTNNGYLDFLGDGYKYLRGPLNNSRIINHKANIDISLGGVLKNQSLGDYEIQTDTGFTCDYGNGSISNYGLFRKVMSSGTSNIAPAFNNYSGTVNIITGTLQLSGGGGSTGGTFNISPSCKLDLSNGIFTVNDICYLKGLGSATLTGGTLQLADFSSLSSDLPAGLKLTGGTISGRGELVNARIADWSSSALIGAKNVKNNSSLTISGTSNKTVQDSVFGNNGTITHTGTGSLAFSQSSQFYNLSGATYELQADAHFLNSDATSTFNNNGTLRKNWSTGLSIMEPAFINRGYVDLQTGTLTLSGGGSFIEGAANVVRPAILNMAGGQYTVYGIFQTGGSGSAQLNSGTISLAEGAQAKFGLEQSLFLAGTNVTGHGTLTNTWNANWSAGTFSGTSRFGNEGSLTLSGNSEKLLQGAELYNMKEIIQTGNGNLRMDQTSLLENPSKSTYDFQSNGGIAGGGTINNRGLFRRVHYAGISTIEPLINNIGGKFLIDSGSICLTGGGTFYSSGGDIVSPGNLTIAAGNYIANEESVFIGMGSATLLGGVLSLNTGAQMRFALETGLQFAGITVKGPGNLINGVNCQWTEGLLSASTNFINEGSISLLGERTKYIQASKLINPGTITHDTAATLDFKQGSTLDNIGTYVIMVDTSLTCSDGGSAINNKGTFRKDRCLGTTVIEPAFNNSGLIDVKTGILRLTRGGSFTNGAANIVGPAKLDMASGLYNLIGEFVASGTGSAVLSGTLELFEGGRANFNLDQGFQLTGGNITGRGSVNIGVAGSWTSGMVAEEATLANLGTLTLSGPDNKYLNRGHLFVQSLINHTGSGALDVGVGSSVEITSPGTYDIKSDCSLTGAGQINNGGIFRKSGGVETTFIESKMNNTGTVEVTSGTLIFNGAVSQLIEGDLSGGKWIVSPYSTLDMGGEHSITSNGAEVTLSGKCWFSQFDSVTTNNGIIRLLASHPFRALEQFINQGELELGGGTFTSSKIINKNLWHGSGTITGDFDNRGTLQPVCSAKNLRVGGNYTQAEAGTLDMVIGGIESGTSSKLDVSGSATLGGTLNINRPFGFVPKRGDVFRILNYQSHFGRFDVINGRAINKILSFNPVYTSTGLVLIVGTYMPELTEVASVAAVKQQEPGRWLSLQGVVSAVFSDCFFIQDANRAAGLRIEGVQTAPTVGQRVNVAGQIYSYDMCITLKSAQWAAYSDAPQPPRPLFITGKNLGGAQLGLQEGVKGGVGLNNVGLLVKITGKVTYLDPGKLAYMDDGSGLNDGNTLGPYASPVPGVRVIIPEGIYIEPGAKQLTVTRVSYRFYVHGYAQRAVIMSGNL